MNKLFIYDETDAFLTKIAGCDNWGYFSGRCEAVEKNAVRIGATSVYGLLSSFDKLIARGYSFDEVLFYTHGNIGYVHFPAGGIQLAHVGQLIARRRLLRPNAKVLFLCCNVAENEVGTRFLLNIGSCFLGGGGGFVAGSTAFGIAWRVPFIDAPLTDIMRFWGELKIVRVQPGGVAQLVARV